MGLQQSKEELVYQQVNYGNADGIRALRAQGAGLEARMRFSLLFFFLCFIITLHRSISVTVC
jgi:hypothetical protein